MALSGNDLIVYRLRTFAIAAVVMIHSSMHFTGLTQIDASMVGTLALNVLSQFAVPCFFFVSGFALTKSYKPDEGIFAFYKKRFIKILPLYLIACFLYGIAFHIKTLNLISYSRSVIFGSASYHLWFMPVLFQFYLIFPFIMPLFEKFSQKISPPMLVVICFSLQIIGQIALQDASSLYLPESVRKFTELLGNRFCLYYLGYFAFGMMIAKSQSGPKISYIATCAFFLLCVGLRLKAHLFKLDGVDVPVILNALMTPAYTVLSIIIISNLFQKLRDYPLRQHVKTVTDYIAEKSYSIYLFHVFILEIALAFFRDINSLVTTIGVFVIVLATMTTLCLITDKFKAKLLRT